jgi:hypothetical protein
MSALLGMEKIMSKTNDTVKVIRPTSRDAIEFFCCQFAERRVDFSIRIGLGAPPRTTRLEISMA